MTINPQDHIVQIERFDKQKGEKVSKPFLVAYGAIAWFREDFPLPRSRIIPMILDAEKSLVRCEIYVDGVMVSAADVKGGDGTSLEKLQTNAVRRALAFAGYGTITALAQEEGEQHTEMTATAAIASEGIDPETKKAAISPSEGKGRVGKKESRPAEGYELDQIVKGVCLSATYENKTGEAKDGKVKMQVKLLSGKRKGQTISVCEFSRQRFVDAGWIADKTEWSNNGDRAEFAPDSYPVVELAANPKDYFDVKSLHPAGDIPF